MQYPLFSISEGIHSNILKSFLLLLLTNRLTYYQCSLNRTNVTDNVIHSILSIVLSDNNDISLESKDDFVLPPSNYYLLSMPKKHGIYSEQETNHQKHKFTCSRYSELGYLYKVCHELINGQA